MMSENVFVGEWESKNLLVREWESKNVLVRVGGQEYREQYHEMVETSDE